MPLTPTAEIVRTAAERGVGAGAFDVVQIEHAQAIVAGAQVAGRPVILQISQTTARYHGGLEPIALAALSIARAADVPVAVHLDRAESPALVREAVGLGLGSVMFDGSALPYEENVAATREVVAHCHAWGVRVEAGLGAIGGTDRQGGAHAPGVRTDPEQAWDFVAATGADALAVAVGGSPATATREAVLDLALVARLRAALPVPLVLHGSSGLGDEGLAEAVRAGLTKVGIGPRLDRVFTGAVRAHLGAHPEAVDTRRYLSPAREAVAAEVARLLRLLAP